MCTEVSIRCTASIDKVECRNELQIRMRSVDKGAIVIRKHSKIKYSIGIIWQAARH